MHNLNLLAILSRPPSHHAHLLPCFRFPLLFANPWMREMGYDHER